MEEVKSTIGETFEITETEIKIKRLDILAASADSFKYHTLQKSKLNGIGFENNSIELTMDDGEHIQFWINSYPPKIGSEIIRSLDNVIVDRNNLALWLQIKSKGALSLFSELTTQGPVPLSNEKINSDQYRLLRSLNFITETPYRGNKGYYTATMKGFDFYQEMKGF